MSKSNRVEMNPEELLSKLGNLDLVLSFHLAAESSLAEEMP